MVTKCLISESYRLQRRKWTNYLRGSIMIIVNLDVMMAKRKISSNELADKIGITQANLSILRTNKGKAIRFSTLEKICEVLDCTPGDILEYRKEK